MNELIFLLQVGAVCLGAMGAYRLGSQALISFICLCAVLANLLVLEQITLFGLTVTPSDAFSVGAMLALNMLQESWNKKSAQKAITISVWALVFFAVMSRIHLAYIPSYTDSFFPHYQTVLSFMPRLTIASLIAYYISQTTNRLLYGMLITKKSLNIVIRNYGAILASQLLDTILFSFLGLYGIVPNLIPIITFSYIIKVITTLLATPWVAFIKK